MRVIIPFGVGRQLYEGTGGAPLHGDINVRFDLCMDGYSYHIKEYGCKFLIHKIWMLISGCRMPVPVPSLHITLRPHERHDVSNTTIAYYIEAA